ncbi:MAG: HEPN domain-containing protein [Nanoarchaeota archaeon]
MKEETKRWLKLAEDDIKSAESNFNNGQYYVCVFLCQQSVEKALKALLIKKTNKLIKIHDLVILGTKVGMPKELLKACDKLNGTYMDTRYGDINGELPSEKFTKGVSLKFLNDAKEIIKWLKKNI